MRALGALLLVAGGFSFGICALREKRSRIAALRQIEAALELLCSELELHEAPLPEAVSNAARHAEGMGKALLHALEAQFPRLGEASFAQLWTAAVTRTCVPLLPHERDELNLLGHSLGRYELSAQLRELHACCVFLEERRNAAEQAFPGERRLLLGLSAAAGAFLAILLL